MTLKEKFENVLHNWIDKDYDRLHVANELEIDSDEFAINFANWYHFMIEQVDNLNSKFTPKELIEMFKKEKGL